MPTTDPALPVLDLGHLGRQTFGDRDLARDLLLLFVGQCDSLLPVIVEDQAKRAEAAHALLGAARAVGAGRVAAWAEAIEAACACGEPDGGTALIGRLVLATEEVRTAAAAYLDGVSAADGQHLAKPKRVA